MIARVYRFHGHASLKYVYSRGEIVRSKSLALKTIPNKRRQVNRIAVIVSKKVHKSAVVRNRIRRRIYEIVRQQQDGITAAHDMAFMVYDDSLATIPAAELMRTTTGLISKARLHTTHQQGRAIVNIKE